MYYEIYRIHFVINIIIIITIIIIKIIIVISFMQGIYKDLLETKNVSMAYNVGVTYLQFVLHILLFRT
jgi:hypothetical protein